MTTQDLGARIRAARQAAGLSQEKLAEQLGLTRQAVTKWETGQSAPSTENLLRLAEVLGVPVSTLLDEAAPQPPGHPLRILSTREFMQVLRGNLRAALIILACWVLLYLAGRAVCAYPYETSLLGFLFDDWSKYYLFGWLTRGGLFRFVMVISVSAALFLGAWRFAAVTFVISALAIPLGEVLGENPANTPYGHGHDGWLIWCALYLVSAAAGIVLEKLARKGMRLRTRAGAIWAGATLAACAAAVALILCVCVPMTGS